MFLVIILLVCVSSHISSAYPRLNDDCPCSNSTYCKPLKVPSRLEVFIFSTNSSNFQEYDLEKITTIAIFGEFSNALLCAAHEKNIRVVLKAYIPYEQLLNKTYKLNWINEQLDLVQSHWADGINIDIEYPIAQGSAEYTALTQWVTDTANVFHKVFPFSQVTFDVAWSSDCIDGRCYDYKGLLDAVDFLIVMAYDEQSQMREDPFCIARPNSGEAKTQQGIYSYNYYAGDFHNIVLGLPWYGYNYPCVKYMNNFCEIPEKPFRGVNCSDAAGRQYCYTDIMNKFLPKAIEGLQWDNDSVSPFFNYKDDDGLIHQVWFDNPTSLSKKFTHLTKRFFVGGIAIWNGDCALMSDPNGKKMWDALPNLKN